MKRRILKLSYLSFLIVFFLSCCKHKPEREIQVFQSHKGIKTLSISLPRGKLEIQGWGEKIIEINAGKSVYSFLPSDLKLIKFQIDETETTFSINTILPESLNAEADLKIKVPFLLQNLNISGDKIDFSIADTFSNLNYSSKTGNITADLKNQTVKMEQGSGILRATLDMTLSTDILLTNEQGETFINIIKTGTNSFLSTSSYSGNINLVLNSSLSYQLISASTFPHTLDLLTSPEIYESENNKLFINNTPNHATDIKIFLDNQNGKTKITNTFFVNLDTLGL